MKPDAITFAVTPITTSECLQTRVEALEIKPVVEEYSKCSRVVPEKIEPEPVLYKDEICL